ncbi:CYCLIN D4 [Rhynchospora pubera]|uniref:CYCLIN D4 n=1 Tax=Rhynchospora pubera TaxID=906938 RepID=A0AAV8D1J9_9POAL|nr:CYCLIN D4 [Rhynchospora pubera]
MKDIDHKTLLCDEDLFLSTPTPPKQAQRLSFGSSSPDTNGNLEEQGVEREALFMDYLRREKDHTPCHGYLNQLEVSTNLRAARLKAMQHIIHVCKRHGVDKSTLFNAANYLDRFLSLNSCLKWEIWMVELLSTTCVSLACKFYETNIPSLHDLQMEDQEHTFKPSTIQEMELMVLKALDWRLSCINVFSFVSLMLGPNRSGPLNDKLTLLLLHSLLDPLMIKFKASIVASSAIKCATMGEPADMTMLNKIPVDEMDHVNSCTKLLETHLLAINTEGGVKQCSPVSVIPTKDDCLI